MQNKKKTSGKKSGELASPRATRLRKKASENLQGQAKKVTDIITSSARKQKSARDLSKNIDKCVSATNSDTTFGLLKDGDAAVCLDHDNSHDNNSGLTNNKDFDNGAVHQVVETIFSPGFHISRSVGEEIANGEFLKFFQNGDQFEQHGNASLQVGLLNEHAMKEANFNEEALTTMNLACPGFEGDLSSEISTVYLSVRNPKLECIDEYTQENLSANVCVEDEEIEEFDDFDPYLFIKNLPDLYSVVPAFRPVLLPKQTRSCPSTTLVLDLDETLVHSTLEPCVDADFSFSVNFNLKEHTVYVRCRPHLRDFMDRLSGLFEIIIFTASQSIYAEQLLNVLDPKRKVFRHRVYRESCVFVDGNYLKDLSVLGRDLAHVIIIDNSPQAFGFQIDNGIPIESWFDDRSDMELISLLPFLESLVGVEDVRPIIAKKFNLREKIAAAVCPFSSNRRYPLET